MTRALAVCETDERVSATTEGNLAWIAGAACRGMHPETFVPSTNDPAAEAVQRALAVCDRCQVREPCGHYGTAIGAVGVWGGRLLRSRPSRQRR